MKNISKVFGIAFILAVMFVANPASAAYYYQANGGSYWSQVGWEWSKRTNDGYCISGRGPCGSNLWYFQWTYNHAGCGFDEWGRWNMATVLPYVGKVSAWIDGYMGGTMPAANYIVTYNYGSSYNVSVNQNAYYETFAPVASLYRIENIVLGDNWGPGRTCSTASGYRVEFDEVRLDV